MSWAVARSTPWGRSKNWSAIKHSSMDWNQGDPGSPWLINTWLLLITSVHRHSRSMRKQTKKKRGGGGLTVSGISKLVLDFSFWSLWSLSLSVEANAGKEQVLSSSAEPHTSRAANGIEVRWKAFSCQMLDAANPCESFVPFSTRCPFSFGYK